MEGFVEMDPTTGNRLAPVDPKMGVVFFFGRRGGSSLEPPPLAKKQCPSNASASLTCLLLNRGNTVLTHSNLRKEIMFEPTIFL